MLALDGHCRFEFDNEGQPCFCTWALGMFYNRPANCNGPENCDGNQPVPANAIQLQKPLWSTEQHIGENGLGGNVTKNMDRRQSSDLPIWNWNAALGMAKIMNQG